MAKNDSMVINNMITPEFQKHYRALNPAQKEAVDTIDGPVMVMAGPGTGKTQILTLRMANILLKTDTNPENILALTFTDSASANMRRRLTQIIGSAGYYVNISTFHSFCNQIIQSYPENFPHIIGSALARPVDQISLLRQIIQNTHLKYLKPLGNKFFYVTEILKNIRHLKNEGLAPADFKKTIQIPPAFQKQQIDPKELKQSEKNKELALVYQKYQKALREKKLYDFEDMVLETVKALATQPDFLTDLQEKYQYILVDEHQDTNGSQNKAVELLASFHPNPNLFIVGDEKQAIFRFQGASLENFLYFKNKYPKVKLVALTGNYRSGQNILDAAQSLIEKNTALLALPPLQSRQKISGQKIKICAFNSPEAEYLFIAEQIKEKLSQKIPPRQIAVIFRENKDSAPLAEFLTAKNIPFVIESDEDILKDNDIKKINALLEAIADPSNTSALIKALHLDCLKIDPLKIYRLAASKKINSADLIALYPQIAQWRQDSFNLPFNSFFVKILRASGYLADLLAQPDYFEKLQKINSLYREIKKITLSRHDFHLKDYLEYAAVLKEHRLGIKSKPNSNIEAVRLMTAHKAKGLEFEVIFIMNVYNGHWGNKTNRVYFKLPTLIASNTEIMDKNEDERRLFYMALTRAKKEIFITYAQTSSDGKELSPSQFIAEIKPELTQELASEAYEKKILDKKNNALALASLQPIRLAEKRWIKELFLRRGLSPTSLNNYLTCPWRYFYQNLLRLPQALSNSQIYGSAKHKALQSFFDAKKNQASRIDGLFLKKEYNRALEKYPLALTDAEQLSHKGVKSLTDYYNFYKNNWNYQTINEFKISGVNLTPQIKLTGMIDKLELDEKSREVNVVDYKTKQPQSRNWILGKTKNSDGGYFRQLVFYKLLLELLPKSKYEVNLGAIDFIEPLNSARGKPSDKGIFKKEIFEVTADDVKNLKEMIVKAADEIINLKFWDIFCAKKDCEYCALRKLLPSNIKHSVFNV